MTFSGSFQPGHKATCTSSFLLRWTVLVQQQQQWQKWHCTKHVSAVADTCTFDKKKADEPTLPLMFNFNHHCGGHGCCFGSHVTHPNFTSVAVVRSASLEAETSQLPATGELHYFCPLNSLQLDTLTTMELLISQSCGFLLGEIAW